MEQLYRPHSLAIIFWIVIGCWVVINFWSGQGHRAKERTKAGRQSDFLVFFSAEVTLIGAFLLKLMEPNSKIYNGPTLFWVGIILIVLGIGLRQFAIKTLGKYHVMTIMVEHDQPTLKTGPYRFVRHPSYLGAILSIIGVAISLNSLIGGAILTILTIATLVHRIKLEDDYLIRHLGKRYEDYAKDTAKLLPHIW